MEQTTNNTLQVGQIVQLGGMKYIVRSYAGSGQCYLRLLEQTGGNDKFFLDLKFLLGGKKYYMQTQVLGYSISGQFPECKSLKDLTKFYHYLQIYEPLLGKKFKKVNIVPPEKATVGTWHIDSEGVATFQNSWQTNPPSLQHTSDKQVSNPLHKNLLPVTQRLVIK